MTHQESRRFLLVVLLSSVLRWDGVDWTIIPSPITSDLTSVAAVSANDAWAVSGTTILRWNGTSWATADVNHPVAELQSVSALSATSAWAVGRDSNYDCTTLHFIRPVSLSINNSSGKPGSFFTLTGANFPSNSTASVIINGNTLTSTLPVDAGGGFVFLLDTSQASAGYYNVTASVNPSASASFVLDPSAPLRPQDGDGPIINVPGGIAWQAYYLPLIRR
jgi:hypothetical protein